MRGNRSARLRVQFRAAGTTAACDCDTVRAAFLYMTIPAVGGAAVTGGGKGLVEMAKPS